MSSEAFWGHVASSTTMFVSLVASIFLVKWIVGSLDPSSNQRKAAQKQAEKIIRSLGLKTSVQLSEYEMTIASLLVDPLSMRTCWNHIGGLNSLISNIKESVVLPFKHKKLFSSSSLLSAPKGILLYGPPGCGKTMIAKATAKETGCHFINLDVASLTDKWYGESNKLASAVFSLAVKIQPCIVFIDEIDSFLRTRSSDDHEATAMMKAQFMSLWDGLISTPDVEVIVLAATNRPQDIDKAILRRLPCRFQVGLPVSEQRQSILQVIMAEEDLSEDVDVKTLASLTNGYSGSDLKELCREAALQCLRSQMPEDDDEVDSDARSAESELVLRPLEMDDFLEALNRMKRNRNIFSSDILREPLD